MKKSTTLALAGSLFAIALATTPHGAFAASSGKHIKKVAIEMTRASGATSQGGWWSGVLSYFGL